MELIAEKENQSVYLQAQTSGLTEIHKLSVMKSWGLGVSRLFSKPYMVINVDGGSCSRRTKVSSILIK